MSFWQRVAKLEKGARKQEPGAVVMYMYHVGDEADRAQKRREAIWNWQAMHGKKLDEKNTQWIEMKIFETREDVAKYGDSGKDN